MVKKYSKRTYKRKNKISKKRKSKRNHSRYKKKKTKKKKVVQIKEDNIKAGMKSGTSSPPPVSLEPEPESPQSLDLLDIIKTKQTTPASQKGQVNLLNRLLNMPSGDELTVTRVNHNGLDTIKDEISNSGCDTVYVLLISNHGNMRIPAGSSLSGYEIVHGRRKSLSVPQNSAIVFNILPGESDFGGGDPDTEMRYHGSEDLILKTLSDNIENYEDLDNLFERDGCLSEQGEILNSGLTKIDHYAYDIYGGIHTTPIGKTKSMVSETEGSGKIYGILNKLQVYKQGENYSDLSFGSSRDEDKNKLGLLFKFKNKGKFVYYYYNFLEGGHTFSDSGVITLSNILSKYVKPLIDETVKNFIITYRACRIGPSDLQRTSSAKHGNSDSVDCYIKKFHQSNRPKIKQTIEDLARVLQLEFENMIDFYEYLRDEGYLDYFVKLEEEGKIVKFFRVLATEKEIDDQWLVLAKKERRRAPPRSRPSPPI